MKSSSIKKVLLTVPPTGLYIREDRCQTPIEHMTTVALRPPIELLYAAACFEAEGASCRLVDYPGEQLELHHLLADIDKMEPDLVILSITTPGIEDDMAVAAAIKAHRPDCIVAAKGAHFNTLDVESLRRWQALDLVFRGELEAACREMAQGKALHEIAGISFRKALIEPEALAEKAEAEIIDDSIIRTPARAFIEDLDSLPFPARQLANNELYRRPDTGALQTTVVANRGCPFSCVYCLANQVAGRKHRIRSPKNLVDELQECVEKYGIRDFLFRSDLFTARKEWVLEVCAEIERRGLDIDWSCNSRVDTIDPDMLTAMKRAGCWIIAFGIESGSQEMLDKIGKKTDLSKAREALRMTRKAGILSSVYFMVGLPWDTPESLAANEKFAREIDPDIMEVFYVYPFPGTPLYEEAVRLGLLEAGSIPKAAYDGPAMAALEMSREELMEARNHALKNFYLQPRVILRTLARSRSFRELWNYLRYGLRQLKEFL